MNNATTLAALKKRGQRNGRREDAVGLGAQVLNVLSVSGANSS